MATPRLPWPDDSLRLLRDGYLYGERGFRRAGSDAFRTRLLGRPVTVVRGPGAARFFYEGGRFDRSPGAVPRSAVHLLQDAGSVQTLEGAAHAERKALFLAVLDDPVDLVAVFREGWRRRAATASGAVSLREFASEVLAEAVERWAGLAPGTLAASELTGMIDNAGRVGPPNWAARARRMATERTVRAIVAEERWRPPTGTPLSRLAHHTEGGDILPLPVAAIELLNLLRPTVAVARFVTFAALALHHRPDLARGLAGDPARREAFAQEVRRFFPFFPMVGGHATRDLVWDDEPLPAGSWLMLDLYGTDHDPKVWPEPRRFDPSRFAGDAAPVVAQGTGEFVASHHCPGEPATNLLIEAAVDLLLTGPAYRVPAQDLRISLRGFPAAPRDGFRVEFARG